MVLFYNTMAILSLKLLAKLYIILYQLTLFKLKKEYSPSNQLTKLEAASFKWFEISLLKFLMLKFTKGNN